MQAQLWRDTTKFRVSKQQTLHTTILETAEWNLEAVYCGGPGYAYKTELTLIGFLNLVTHGGVSGTRGPPQNALFGHFGGGRAVYTTYSEAQRSSGCPGWKKKKKGKRIKAHFRSYLFFCLQQVEKTRYMRAAKATCKCCLPRSISSFLSANRTQILLTVTVCPV